MDLICPDVLKIEALGRLAEETAELGNRVEVGSLGRRRQIADRHVLDHPAAQRADLGHLGFSCCERGLRHPYPLRQEALRHLESVRRCQAMFSAISSRWRRQERMEMKAI